jgi:hypothetical protein
MASVKCSGCEYWLEAGGVGAPFHAVRGAGVSLRAFDVNAPFRAVAWGQTWRGGTATKASTA